MSSTSTYSWAMIVCCLLYYYMDTYDCVLSDVLVFDSQEGVLVVDLTRTPLLGVLVLKHTYTATIGLHRLYVNAKEAQVWRH